MHQLAFYRAVLREVIGLVMPVFFVAVEKKEPFRAGVWVVDPQILTIAERENAAAISRLKQCQAEDRWPTESGVKSMSSRKSSSGNDLAWFERATDCHPL